MCSKDARSQLMGLEFSITHSKRPTDPIIFDMSSFLLNEVLLSFMFYFTCSILKQQNKLFNNKISARRHSDVTHTGRGMLLMRLVANFHNSRISPQDLTLTFVKELTTVVLEKKPETHCKAHKQSLSKKVPKFPNICRRIAFIWQWMPYTSVPLSGIIHVQQKNMLLHGEMCKASYSTDHWREQIIKSQPEYKPKLESMTVIYTCTHVPCASVFNPFSIPTLSPASPFSPAMPGKPGSP